MQDSFIKNVLTKNFVDAGRQFQTMISAKVINTVENTLVPEVSQRILVKENNGQE